MLHATQGIFALMLHAAPGLFGCALKRHILLTSWPDAACRSRAFWKLCPEAAYFLYQSDWLGYDGI